MRIASLAELVKDAVAPEVEIVFDRAKPDGTPRKLLDVSRIRDLGWRHRVELSDGIAQTYHWFREHYDEAVGRARPLQTRTLTHLARK